MRLAESYHRYPRPMTGTIAGLAALLVALAIANLGIVFLSGVWDLLGHPALPAMLWPPLQLLVSWIENISGPPVSSISELLVKLLLPLGFTATALFSALMLRNTLPAIRTSDIGLLVEFAGSWLPLRWEELRVIRATSDAADEHFVLLVESTPARLTAWHHIYSLVYGAGPRRGFYITSKINQFDQLLQTMISQSERTTRVLEGVRPVQVREDEPSAFFSLLLSPGAFFSRQTRQERDLPASSPLAREGDPVRAVYPPRINLLISGVNFLLAAVLVFSYLAYWVRFLALSLPSLRPIPPFNLTARDPVYFELFQAYATRGVPLMGVPDRPDLPAPWWILLAAHLMLLIGVPALLWLRAALPAIESRNEGLAVRTASGGGWRVIPWAQVQALRATEISDEHQILLLQSPTLPNYQRLSSLLYDGSRVPGLLITSAISNFQLLMQYTLNRIIPLEHEDRPPILQQEAHSWLFWLALRRRSAQAALADAARLDPETTALLARRALAAAGPSVVLALLPALLLLSQGLLSDNPPSMGLLVTGLGLWLLGLLEWPLVSLSLSLLDDKTGNGEEGYRALYLYPLSQLPRVLPLLAALLCEIVRLPLLPILAWGGAVAWAYWLTRGICEQLYDWRGSLALLGGLLPVLWQLLLLIGYLLATR